MKKAWVENIAVFFIMLAVGIAASWPLALHFATAIPCKFSASSIAVDRPGDNLQLLYWFWLLKDNLFGASGFFHNPYEFNFAAADPPQQIYIYPLYFLFLLFAPLGDIPAYNSLVLISYPLTGLFTYLLVRTYTGSRLGAFIGALIYTLAPLRIINMMGGHLNGFIYYFLPVILYCLEKALQNRNVLWSVPSGLFIFWLCLLEFHLIYYLTLIFGIFLPLRLLSDTHPALDSKPSRLLDPAAGWGSILRIWLVGLALTIHFHSTACLAAGAKVFNTQLPLILGLYPLLFLLLVLVATSAVTRITHLSEGPVLRVLSLVLLPFSLLSLQMLNHLHRIPGLNRAVIAAAILTSTALLWRQRNRLRSAATRQGSSPDRPILAPVLRSWWPAALGLLLAVGWMLILKARFFSTSIAAGGRSLQEIERFSPTFAELFIPASDAYLGSAAGLLILIAGAAALHLTARAYRTGLGVRQPMLLRLSLFCFILTFLLGAGLAFGPSSLYIVLYNHLPYFNYSRVPDRILIFAFLFAAILSGFALAVLDSWARKHRRPILVQGMSGLLILILAYEYGVPNPTGLTELDRGQDIYRYVSNNIEQQLLLELPLWQGDRHQSSLFEYYITLDRVRRVNGYTPLVDRSYLEEVYAPLASLNRGLLSVEQYRMLRRMGVRYLTVHENAEVFPYALSRQPPATTVRHLMLSPLLEYIPLANRIVMSDGTRSNPRLHLFRLADTVDPSLETAHAIEAALAPTDIYPASELEHLTGRLQTDPSIGRKVLRAAGGKDNPHFLSYGPYTEYPAGNYTVRFRIRCSAPAGANAAIARLDASAFVAHEAQEILAERIVTAEELRGEEYHDIDLHFVLDRMRTMEFRTFFIGNGDLWLEKILVSTEQNNLPGTIFEAELLPGETGTVARDAAASAGWAVQVLPSRDQKGRAVYGPNSSFPKGRYQAAFFLRSCPPSPGGGPAETQLVVKGSDGGEVLADAKVPPAIIPRDRYGPLTLEFDVKRTDELEFSVLVSGKTSLLIDRVEVRSVLAGLHH